MPNGSRSIGDRAEILPVLCEVYLGARHEGVTVPSQLPAAKAAEILIRGFARVGIIALVYEATGYQEVRARYELQAILEAYVRPEFRKWLKAFPDDFFRDVQVAELGVPPRHIETDPPKLGGSSSTTSTNSYRPAFSPNWSV